MTGEDSDGEIDVNGVQSDVIQKPLKKKRKLASPSAVPAPAKQQQSSYEYDLDEELKLIELGEEFYEEKRRLDEKYSKEILLHSAPPDPLDISDATLMFVDAQELHRRGAYVAVVRVFVNECLNRNTLQIYDHPGDPRCGGFNHWEHPSMTDMEMVRNVADFAFEVCCDLCKKDGLRLLSVDKISVRPSCHCFYYLTFTVVDELTNEEITFQAEIIEITFKQYMLGLLRDASHDRVVAVMQIKGGTVEGEAYSLPNVPENPGRDSGYVA